MTRGEIDGGRRGRPFNKASLSKSYLYPSEDCAAEPSWRRTFSDTRFPSPDAERERRKKIISLNSSFLHGVKSSVSAFGGYSAMLPPSPPPADPDDSLFYW